MGGYCSTLNRLSSFQAAIPKHACFLCSDWLFFLFSPGRFKNSSFLGFGTINTSTFNSHPALLPSCIQWHTTWHSAFICPLLVNLSCCLLSESCLHWYTMLCWLPWEVCSLLNRGGVRGGGVEWKWGQEEEQGERREGKLVGMQNKFKN